MIKSNENQTFISYFVGYDLVGYAYFMFQN